MHAKHTLLAIVWSGFYSSGFSTPTCVHHNLHRSVFHHGDRCAQSMQSLKIALLFLTKGEIALEPLWRRWFEDIEGLVYRGCKPAAAEASEDCRAHLHHRPAGTGGGPIASQHLFNVYEPYCHLSADVYSLAYCRTFTTLAVVKLLLAQHHVHSQFPLLCDAGMCTLLWGLTIFRRAQFSAVCCPVLNNLVVVCRPGLFCSGAGTACYQHL